jgi:hypothetical protein
MRELIHVRPDYVVQHGDDEDRCPDAHRVVRNSIAVAEVLRREIVGGLFDALTAIEHAETPVDGARVLTSHDASALATVLEQVYSLLKSALDEEWRPQGVVANLILEEAALPATHSDGTLDMDRVFDMTADGGIALRYPRISLYELNERLPEVAAFLRRAAENGNTVLVDDE